MKRLRLCLAAVSTAWACRALEPTPRTTELLLRGNLFTLELAVTPKDREQGLMYRPTIPFDGGMLFVFPDEQLQAFWMAHTLVDLDIVFVDDTGRVTAVHEMVAEPPQRPDESWDDYTRRLPRYESRKPARFALEFKAGTLNLLQLKPGDHIDLDTERLLPLAH